MYTEHIKKKVRKYMGWDENDKSHDEEIDSWDKFDVLDKCLKWEGIIGYTAWIRDLIEGIYEVKL